MANNYLKCDTDSIRTTCKDMRDLLVEYEKVINRFFDRLDFSKNDQIAFTGSNANLYAHMVMLDKADYVKFGEELKILTADMEDYANDLEDVTSRNEDYCEHGQDDYDDYR